MLNKWQFKVYQLTIFNKYIPKTIFTKGIAFIVIYSLFMKACLHAILRSISFVDWFEPHEYYLKTKSESGVVFFKLTKTLALFT
jgi:hypothetical protein